MTQLINTINILYLLNFLILRFISIKLPKNIRCRIPAIFTVLFFIFSFVSILLVISGNHPILEAYFNKYALFAGFIYCMYLMCCRIFNSSPLYVSISSSIFISVISTLVIFIVNNTFHVFTLFRNTYYDYAKDLKFLCIADLRYDFTRYIFVLITILALFIWSIPEVKKSVNKRIYDMKILYSMRKTR